MSLSYISPPELRCCTYILSAYRDPSLRTVHMMLPLLGFAYLSLLPFVVVVDAAIGPVADLHITNTNLAPDGFNRTVVVAEGTMPGPLIKGNKVGGTNSFRYQRSHTPRVTDSRLM